MTDRDDEFDATDLDLAGPSTTSTRTRRAARRRLRSGLHDYELGDEDLELLDSEEGEVGLRTCPRCR